MKKGSKRWTIGTDKSPFNKVSISVPFHPKVSLCHGEYRISRNRRFHFIVMLNLLLDLSILPETFRFPIFFILFLRLVVFCCRVVVVVVASPFYLVQI